MGEADVHLCRDLSVDRAVLTIARERPRHPAVTLGDETVDYGELSDRALELVRELTGLPPQRIGIEGHRSIAAIVAMLGISSAGHSFAVLNPENPEGLRFDLRKTAGIQLVIDPLTGELHRDDRFVPSPVGEEIYLLHTSGSSGRPKGVSISRGNLAYSTGARFAVHGRSGVPVSLLLFPLHFDGAMASIWGTLAAGGHLVIADEAERRDPDAIADLIERHAVTHTITVPSLHAELLPVLADRRPALKLMVVAGEALTRAVIDQHFALLPKVPLCNEYGPTECTIWASYRTYDSPAPPAIGFPIPGTEIELLDDRLRAVPDGEVGQIAVSGPGVSAGYVGDPEETAARFAGGRYLTGDLGRRRADGELEFVGRLDNEIKMRGVRVTLETIEAAVAAAPGVLAAAVAYDAANSTCYAFVVGRAAGVRARVAELLGPALVPDHVLVVETLPRTAHDKVDRERLLADALPAPVEADDGTLAGRIAGAWATVLGVSPVQAMEGANFFGLGGNSLSVLKLARTLSAVAGRRITARELYRHSTLDEQLALIGGRDGA
ncbi:non-ribosomal peptide synthetase [Streptosporangium sp. NPDC023615]|uniref:non-ribosomal peptide synthetase n=1 Tax=Streptosporangium sp. NPDC023615 TaxID=3154794 RepID=UPI00343A1A7A